MSKSLRIADLFCGAGGLAEGFRQAGFAVVVGSDFDPDASATFGLNFPEAEIVTGDLRAAKTRRKVMEAAADQIDVLVGGPPCQAFSQVRNHQRLIDDPRNALYREFVRALRSLEPQAFVMENVPGLQQMGIKEQVLEDLTVDGLYSVRAQLVDAADFGVPQTRKRLIFMGIQSSLEIDPPILSGSGATDVFSLDRLAREGRTRYSVNAKRSLFATVDVLRDPNDSTYVTSEQALSDLDFLKAGNRSDEILTSELPAPQSAYQRLMRAGESACIKNVSVPRINADTKLRLLELPPGGNFRDLPLPLTKRYISGSVGAPTMVPGVSVDATSTLIDGYILRCGRGP